jgi:predicted DsbA family dithiol-disulfide isomerase
MRSNMLGLAVGHKHGEITVVEITVFADYVCPFSYLTWLGLEELESQGRIGVVRRAFELRPPSTPALPAYADAEWDIVVDVALQHGRALTRPAFRPRTRKAHEAVKMAETVGKGAVMHAAIFDAYFNGRRDIGRIDVLSEIGAGVGIDHTALKVALDVDVHTEDVLADEALAHRLEIEGTPALIAGADVRVGYLSAEHLRDWLKD